jgi:hypothetical protein
MARPRHRIFLTGVPPRQEEVPDLRLDLGHSEISHTI